MIRFIIVVIIVVFYLVLSLPYAGLEWILGKFNREASDLRQLRVVQSVFKLVVRITGVKLTVIGEENVPTDKPVLYVANHKSIFDVVITYARCPRLTGYISKNNLEHIPLLNLWMRRLHCLFLNREDIKPVLIMLKMASQCVSSLKVPEIKVRSSCFHLKREVLKLPKKQAARLSLWHLLTQPTFLKIIFHA